MPTRSRPATEPARRERWQAWGQLDKRVWQMAFARCINTMGLSLAMTFLGIYVVETRGYPAWLYGAIALGANLGQSVSNAWAGDLSDRIGRRRVMTTAQFIRAGVIAGLGTQIILDAPLWSLAAVMLVNSSLRGCFEPVAYALVADVVTEDQRISAFGLQRMGTNLGWVIGPALGGVLTLAMPYGAVFYVAAGGMLAAAVVTMRVEEPAPRAPQAKAEAVPGELRAALAEWLRDPMLRMLLIGTFLFALLQTQMFATFGIYMTHEVGLSKADVGLLYALNGGVVLALQLPALELLRRIGIGRALPLASLVGTAGFAAVGAAGGFGGAAAAIVLITCGEVLLNPAHQTAIAESADPARRGRAYGIAGFVQMLGIAVAPLAGGVLLDTIAHHHGGLMWVAIGAIGVAQAACFALFVRRRNAQRLAAARGGAQG